MSSENLKLQNYAVDEELQEKIRPYAEETKIAVNEPIGRLSGSWDNNSMFYTEQTDTISLVEKAMMDGGEKALRERFGRNEQAFYDAYKVDHMGIDVSITSVSVRGVYTAKPGDISMKDVFSIYRYTNLLVVLPLKGSEIRAIMEENAADRLCARVLNGKPYYYSFDDEYTDLLFGGINFTYDFAKEKGQRVIIHGMAAGRPFEDDAVYLAATCDYLVGNEKCGLRNHTEKDNLIEKEIRIVDMVADYIRQATTETGGVTSDAFNWHWNADYIMTAENAKPYEGKVYATLSEKPADGKTYVLVHEPTGMAVVDESGALKMEKVRTMRNDIIEPLPENTMRFTVQYVTGEGSSPDRITLRNPNGEYLTCENLSWTSEPENSRVEWELAPFNGAWRIISTEELADGNKKAIEVYKTTLSTYELLPIRCNFCFNFYELEAE